MSSLATLPEQLSIHNYSITVHFAQLQQSPITPSHFHFQSSTLTTMPVPHQLIVAHHRDLNSPVHTFILFNKVLLSFPKQERDDIVYYIHTFILFIPLIYSYSYTTLHCEFALKLYNHMKLTSEFQLYHHSRHHALITPHFQTIISS